MAFGSLHIVRETRTFNFSTLRAIPHLHLAYPALVVTLWTYFCAHTYASSVVAGAGGKGLHLGSMLTRLAPPCIIRGSSSYDYLPLGAGEITLV